MPTLAKHRALSAIVVILIDGAAFAKNQANAPWEDPNVPIMIDPYPETMQSGSRPSWCFGWRVLRAPAPGLRGPFWGPYFQ